MAFSQEFIENNGLSEEQVSAIQGHLDSEIVPSIKKEFEGKANENAEGILAGASKYGMSKLGVDLEREQGEKWGDYYVRISDKAFESKQKELSDKQAELDEKLANFKGGEEYKQQLDVLKSEKDELLRQVAELEPLKGLDVKYKDASDALSSMQKEVAYANVKPSFPESTNKYEAEAKWNAWKKEVEEKYNIQLVDGKPVAVDKENQYKTVPLKELLEGDKDISDLLKGRQQNGLGSKASNLETVEGIPFKIPTDATPEDITALVREHTLKQHPDVASDAYQKAFTELYLKVKAARSK